MNKILEQYLNEKKEAQLQIKEQEKTELLINEGLYEKILIDASEVDFENDLVEYSWDESTQSNAYFKKIPIEITDEEYNELLSFCETEEHSSNTVATTLTVIAWIIYIAGLITGLVYISEEAFLITLLSWFSCFISGTMFLGFAEIIKLLQSIKNK